MLADAVESMKTSCRRPSRFVDIDQSEANVDISGFWNALMAVDAISYQRSKLQDPMAML